MREAGTTPLGTTDEQANAKWVQKAFEAVAPRYDLLNHLLSLNIDRTWRKRLLKTLQPVLSRSEAKVLDLCCGTGDVLLELQGASAARVLGADFCHPMLVCAKDKIERRHSCSLLFEGDAMRLPLRDDSLDAISIAFGFRNLSNYEVALRELFRVLKDGGTLGLLEFSHPRGLFMKTTYGAYSSFVLPAIGRMISGSKEAYSYLPESIRKFPEPEQLMEMMQTAGFRGVEFELLTGGIAAVHAGIKRL